MNLSRAAEKNFACSSPQNAQTTQKPTGLRYLEYTERIDAVRHTTEGTELIACVATPRLSMVAVYGGARLLYLYLLCLYTDQQAFISVDSCIAKRRPFCGFEKLKPVGFCVVCAFCGNYIQKNYK